MRRYTAPVAPRISHARPSPTHGAYVERVGWVVVRACSAVGLAIVSLTMVNAGVTPPAESGEADAGQVGSRACQSCHAALYEAYSQTAMARTSGPALPHLIEGSFTHALSGVRYTISRLADRAILSYHRDPDLQGSRRLKYFIGSNTRGRAFVFEIDGFLYNTPINYYAARDSWDMAPGTQGLREMMLNRPIDRSCLFCHADRIQPTIDGTSNRFGGEAFLQDGVGCERCHGPGGRHVKGLGPMVNPSRLPAARRDSICMQCHLEGQSRIARAGRTIEEYTPGDLLSDSIAVFGFEDAAGDMLGAVSHVESLAMSACKRESGDAMSCTSCHDPHVQSRGEARIAAYRARCLGCHSSLPSSHHADQRDCTACHMPRMDSADISHTAVTDHRIPRRPRVSPPPVPAAGRRLVEFGNPRPDPRDLGLAYAEIALRGDAFARGEAFRLLEEALPEHPADPEVLTHLGYLCQTRGDLTRATTLYERALAANPNQAAAAANLGVLYADRGRLAASLVLWQRVFDRNPHRSEVGINLGIGLCAQGDRAAARRAFERVLAYNPDSGHTKRLLATLAAGRCGPG